jgi:hypothetical protein
VLDGTTIFDPQLAPIDSSPLAAMDATPPAAIRPTVTQTATAAANPTDINRSAPPEIQSSVLSPEQQVRTLTTCVAYSGYFSRIPDLHIILMILCREQLLLIKHP